MIGWLRGTLRTTLVSEAIIIDVAGVGYEVHLATRHDVSPGEELELFIHTVVRADAIILYGFLTYEERSVFELLLNTPGVGPSMALAALRTLGSVELARAIECEDVKAISRVSGIGPKTASRIVLELRGKIVTPARVESGGLSGLNAVVGDALRSLGYAASDVREVLKEVELSSDESQALREALALMRSR